MSGFNLKADPLIGLQFINTAVCMEPPADTAAARRHHRSPQKPFTSPVDTVFYHTVLTLRTEFFLSVVKYVVKTLPASDRRLFTGPERDAFSFQVGCIVELGKRSSSFSERLNIVYFIFAAPIIFGICICAILKSRENGGRSRM